MTRDGRFSLQARCSGVLFLDPATSRSLSPAPDDDTHTQDEEQTGAREDQQKRLRDLDVRRRCFVVIFAGNGQRIVYGKEDRICRFSCIAGVVDGTDTESVSPGGHTRQNNGILTVDPGTQHHDGAVSDLDRARRVIEIVS